MKKLFFLGLLIMVLIVSGCGQKKTTDNNVNVIDLETNKKISMDIDCPEICSSIEEACGPLIPKEDCLRECPKWSDETIQKIFNAYGCEVFLQNEEFIGTLITDMEKPQMVIPETSDCEAACGNYVMSCLVPDSNVAITEESITEELESCMFKCLKWDVKKIGCIINSFDCQSMNDACGL